MKVDPDQITAILYKHAREEALSTAEKELLEKWLQQSVANRDLLEQLQDEQEVGRYLAVMMDEQHTESAFQSFKNNKLTTRTIRLYPRRWAAAAAIILVLGTATYFLATRHQQAAPVVQTQEILPGREGATLTLADGSTILLDTVHSGVMALQGGITARVANGKLSYEGNSGQMAYNKIATPKARQYQLVLPDGTEVWLNAASAIRFPTVFTGRQRKVEITGEAYFEVAQNRKTPFVVSVNNAMAVEVLGTHFNVNAYDNEDHIATTLLEGAVKVIKGNEQRIMSPGEQAQVKANIYITKNVDTGKVIAWKNGVFDFDNTPLEAVMRQLERWYDIEVVYENGVPDVQLIGKMTKDVPLNGLLKNLKELGVRYRIEGRTLTVLPAPDKK